MTPSISIIMPCYNAADKIGGAIRSIQSQSLSNWELIVVDDGSRDESFQLIRHIEEPRLRLFRQKNQGPASARNHGLRKARGAYIAFLDSDDTWHPEFLEKMLDGLEPHDDAILVYCGWQNLGIEGGRGQPFLPPEYDGVDRAQLLLGGCRWPIHGVLVRHDIVSKAGGFDETLRTSEDYDLWLRSTLRGRLIRIPEVLAYYHHEGDHVTANKQRVAINHWRAQQKFLKLHPEEARRLGSKRVRELVAGELLRRAYECYWKRDLPAARKLFRLVIRSGYGRPKDWVYMLPSLLPQPVHAWLLRNRDANNL